MEWLDLLVDLLLPVARDLVVIAVLAIVGVGANWWKNLQIEGWVKELIVDAVLFVQEKFWDLTGEQKFELAKAWILKRLKEKGINVSEEWLEALIDAIVKELRAEFGEEDWYRNQ